MAKKSHRPLGGRGRADIRSGVYKTPESGWA